MSYYYVLGRAKDGEAIAVVRLLRIPEFDDHPAYMNRMFTSIHTRLRITVPKLHIPERDESGVALIDHWLDHSNQTSKSEAQTYTVFSTPMHCMVRKQLEFVVSSGNVTNMATPQFIKLVDRLYEHQ